MKCHKNIFCRLMRKDLVAAAVSKPRRVVREERRAAEPEFDSGPDRGIFRAQKKNQTEMRKKRKNDFDGTDDDSDIL